MELKEGFIKNDIGIIPKDWKIKNIGSICEIYGRIGFRGYTVKDIMPNEEGAITISPSNIQEGKMDFSKCTYISWFKYHESPEIKIYNGDILLVKTGSTFGKTAIIKDLYEKATINPQLVVLKNIKVDNVFLGYIMSYKIVQNQIKSTIVGGAIPTLSQQLVANYKIPLPPTKSEQTAIATALSDADALISSLEKLIEKKRNIKQGVMQELLRPKKGWVVKRLGEICEIRKGQLITEATANYGEIPVIAGGKNPSYFHNQANRFRNTITISGSGANAGYVAFYETPIFASDCSTIEEGTTYSLKFIYYNLQLLQNKIYKAQTGGAQPHIHPSDLAPFEIPFPDLDIQNSVSLALSDMDSEIELLEKKLLKTKMLKQGMMQELLTGRIRLI